MAETVDVATSITLLPMSVSRLRSMEASVGVRTIWMLGGRRCRNSFTKEGVGVGRCTELVPKEIAAYMACDH